MTAVASRSPLRQRSDPLETLMTPPLSLLRRTAGAGLTLALVLVATGVGAQPAGNASEAGAATTAPPQTPETPTSAKAEATEGDAGNPFGPLVGRPGGLTSDQAAERASAISREASVRRAQIDAADAEVDETLYGYAPRVTLTARYTRMSEVPAADFGGGGNLVGTTDPPGPLGPGAPLFGIDSSAFSFSSPQNNYYLNAGVVVPLSDYLLNLSKSLAASKAQRRSAELQERAARALSAANARLTYYRWTREKLAMAEATQAVERAKAQLETVQKRYDAGQVARADVLRAEAFVASSELNLRRASTAEVVSREQLNVQMNGGEAYEGSWEIGEDVLAPFPEGGETKSLAELQREALDRRLEVRALDDTAYALRKAGEVHQTHGLPRIEAFGNFTYANPNPRIFPQTEEWNASWDAGIQVIWTLNDIGTNSSEARKREAEAREVEAQKHLFEDNLRTEVVSAYRTLKEAELATTSAERGLAAAEASYKDRFLLYGNGRATSLDLLEAESALIQARLGLVDAHIALRTARVRLDHAVGRDTQGIE